MPKLPVVNEAEIENTLLGGYIARHKCPHCNGNLKSKEKEIGKPDECPDCGGIFAVSKKILEQINNHKLSLKDNKEKEKRKKKQKKKFDSDLRIHEKIRKQEQLRKHKQLEIWKEQSQRRSQREQATCTRCTDCGKEVSFRAQTCPHCGGPGPLEADARREKQVQMRTQHEGAIMLAIGGVLMLLFFAFGYDTAPEGVHNIGRLNNRTYGLIVGAALITWAIIMGRK